MKFGYAILYVEDVKTALEFYEKAFGLTTKMIHESGRYGELDTGTTTLSFSSLELMTELGKKPVAANAGAPSFEIAFETDDVAFAVERAVKSGAKLVQEPAEMAWGQTVAYVSDDNGFLIEICTPIG